jgi:hypothetical protein
MVPVVSLAHDWALGVAAFSAGTPSPSQRSGELKEMVDIVWEGLRVRGG